MISKYLWNVDADETTRNAFRNSKLLHNLVIAVSLLLVSSEVIPSLEFPNPRTNIALSFQETEILESKKWTRIMCA